MTTPFTSSPREIGDGGTATPTVALDQDARRPAPNRERSTPGPAGDPELLARAAAISAFESAAKAVREQDPAMAAQYARYGIRLLDEDPA